MQGLTLLEVLISLFIFSLLLFGLDAMQVHTLRHAKASFYASVAMQQIENMIEHLKVAKGAPLEELEKKWNEQNQRILPNGRGVLMGIYPHLKIAIFWGKEEGDLECNEDKLDQDGCLHIEW